MEIFVWSVITIIGVYVIWHYVQSQKTLVISVKLKSRQKFNNFSPDDYMMNVNEQQFKVVASIVDESNSNKYRNLTLKWNYTTPSGKNSYTDSQKFHFDELKELVDKLAPIFDQGKKRVSGLNRLYEEQIRDGKELADGIPKIYCYMIFGADHRGLVKVGFAKGSAFKRVRNQLKTAAHMKIDYEVLFIMPAVCVNGNEFKDHSVHKILKNSGVSNPMGEWFRCSPEIAKKAVEAAQNNFPKIVF